MTTIPDWNDDLDALYSAAIANTRDKDGPGNLPAVTNTTDPDTGLTTSIQVTIPVGERSWATGYYRYEPAHWVVLTLRQADPTLHPAGSLIIDGYAVRNTGDGLTELALLAAASEPPTHTSVLTPTRRPEKRAKPGPMTPEHAAHRVWQLIINRAAAVTLDDDTYPLTTALDGMVLYGATRYNRIKARGTIHGTPFRFETTNKGNAHLLLDHDRNGTYTVHGPLPIPEDLLSASVDQQLATLIPLLQATPPNPINSGAPATTATVRERYADRYEDLVFPSGSIIPAPVAAASHYLYLLRRMLHADEASIGRDQKAYKDRHTTYVRFMGKTAQRLKKLKLDHADVVAIAKTFTGPGSYEKRPRSWVIGPAEAILQVGYIVDQLTLLQHQGIPLDAAWAHISLQQHPVRDGEAVFFHTEDPACPWPQITVHDPDGQYTGSRLISRHVDGHINE